MSQLYLFDIEGTTTDIAFVHKVLFPYSYEHMGKFIQTHLNDPQVIKALSEVQSTVQKEEQRTLELDEIISQLRLWIQQDRKHGALKEIQGLIWNEGYHQNKFLGHVYQDVAPAFKRLTQNGKVIAIYSSGSVQAQKLIFKFSSNGDLSPYISHYFDTHMGPKREKDSYEKIAQALTMNPRDIHFFSDIPQELEAAQAAGMMVTHVQREGTPVSHFSSVKDFSLI